MRTPIAIEMQAMDSSDIPSRGTVCVAATEADYSLVVYTARSTCGQFDQYGRLCAQNYNALWVNASDDPGYDTIYTVIVTIDGQDVEEFRCQVPGASTAQELAAQTTEGSPLVTLTSLIAANAMMGQVIVGENWPDGTTVIGFSAVMNTLTLSQNATVTGTCAATVGGAVNIETLRENAL